MDADEFEQETKPLTVDFGKGRVLNLAYRVNVARLKDEFKTDTPEELAAMLCRILKSWDLVRGGVPVPLETEVVANLPFNLINGVLDALTEDRKVSPTSAVN